MSLMKSINRVPRGAPRDEQDGFSDGKFDAGTSSSGRDVNAALKDVSSVRSAIIESPLVTGAIGPNMLALISLRLSFSRAINAELGEERSTSATRTTQNSSFVRHFLRLSKYILYSVLILNLSMEIRCTIRKASTRGCDRIRSTYEGESPKGAALRYEHSFHDGVKKTKKSAFDFTR